MKCSKLLLILFIVLTCVSISGCWGSSDTDNRGDGPEKVDTYVA